MQISELLKDKKGIRNMWVLNSNENLKFRKTEKEKLMKWFHSACAKNIPISSEEKSVNPNEVTDWIGKLKSLLKGYDDRDIFNADETGLFHRILQDKTLCFKGEKCSGRKISKERLTLLLCCNKLGVFETPVVIEKAKKPRCFKNIDEETLHVSNFIHRDTTEALALSEDDNEESPMEDCKIKDYSEALKYSKQLKQFFLNNEDSEGLAKLNPMKIHLEKQV
ncbi:hypothetical protein AVEN_209916-1 [Araneus ventricosus]|uniref:Tigger transposable element-derived protein 4 n=1 Tax=Araneus ventricosus TaxID=182803 RepID=A0A4Y2S7C6_ARAVE|nr:hypothetical protein AVEN_209916-1 [Araneus ventricosus]